MTSPGTNDHPLTASARRLQSALSRQGTTLDEEALEAVARSWQGKPPEQPLAVLDEALRRHGVVLETEARSRVAWALLGIRDARGVRLGQGLQARLTHLVELHDLSLPSAAHSLGRQLAREATLAPDLLRARPWLTGPGPQKAADVLGAVFETEWSGFLALLGEFGPWVYVPSVADLQALSHRYAAVVRVAGASREPDVLAAALGLGEQPEWSLLARLEATDYRQPGAETGSLQAAPEATAALIAAERAFWDAAELQAQGRRAEWSARRGR